MAAAQQQQQAAAAQHDEEHDEHDEQTDAAAAHEIYVTCGLMYEFSSQYRYLNRPPGPSRGHNPPKKPSMDLCCGPQEWSHLETTSVDDQGHCRGWQAR